VKHKYAIAVATSAVFASLVGLFARLTRSRPEDENDPGVEITTLLGVVYPKDDSKFEI